jgi:cytochrome c oxidase cbb3-type subunit 2
MLDPRPRNLVSGSFKFRSTPSGSLPTAEDLLRTIDQGVLGTSMPSFRLMPANEKLALVSYIQSLRADWAELQGRSIALPDPPEEIFRKKATLLASAMRGRQLFMDACQTCHGDRGLGDGPGAEGLIDGEERIIRPADFTRPFLKSGARVKDIYKVVSTGLDGTPMPSFAETYTEAQRWDLVAFVLVRRGQGAGLYPADLDLQLGGTAPVAAAPTTPSAAPAAAPAKGEPSKPSQTGADEWK